MFLTESWAGLTPAQKTIVMHGDASDHLQYSSKTPIMHNLAKKMYTGKYDKKKAEDLWHYHADRCAKDCHSQNGDRNVPWEKAFPPNDRKAAGKYWEETNRDTIHEAKFNADGTLIAESLVDPRESLSIAMLESIVEKKPVVLREKFNAMMKIIVEKTLADYKEELSKTIFKKEFTDKNSKELHNG